MFMLVINTTACCSCFEVQSGVGVVVFCFGASVITERSEGTSVSDIESATLPISLESSDVSRAIVCTSVWCCAIRVCCGNFGRE